MDEQPDAMMTSNFQGNVMPLKLQAEVHRASLLIGLIQPDDVIAWADSHIAAAEAPHASIIDIAMGGRLDRVDLAALLEEVPGECESNTVYRHMLSILNRELHTSRHTTGEIVRMLYELTRVLELERLVEIVDFESDWSLAEDGLMHDIDVLAAELEDWLSQYEDPDNPGPYKPLAPREPYRPLPAHSYKLRVGFILLAALVLGFFTGASSLNGVDPGAIAIILILASLAILHAVNLQVSVEKTTGKAGYSRRFLKLLFLLVLFVLSFCAGFGGFFAAIRALLWLLP